jgi:hypothetical protein
MLRRAERTKSLSEQAEAIEFQIGNICALRVPLPLVHYDQLVSGNSVLIYPNQLLAGKILSPKALACRACFPRKYPRRRR